MKGLAADLIAHGSFLLAAESVRVGVARAGACRNEGGDPPLPIVLTLSLFAGEAMRCGIEVTGTLMRSEVDVSRLRLLGEARFLSGSGSGHALGLTS